jgi:hypothetical protein
VTFRTLLRNCRAASAAEFALVLPLLLVLLFGIIDGGRWLWAYNQAEKATQVGIRFAVVTDPIPSGLAAADYLGVGGLTQGDIIPRDAFGKIECTSTACCVAPAACTTPYPALGTFDSDSFNTIVARMQAIDPVIKPENVLISYAGSGLGYAGDPNGMDISPLVTVKLTGLTFQPITSLLFATLTMPDFAASLTGEDLSGTASN